MSIPKWACRPRRIHHIYISIFGFSEAQNIINLSELSVNMQYSAFHHQYNFDLDSPAFGRTEGGWNKIVYYEAHKCYPLCSWSAGLSKSKLYSWWNAEYCMLIMLHFTLSEKWRSALYDKGGIHQNIAARIQIKSDKNNSYFTCMWPGCRTKS